MNGLYTTYPIIINKSHYIGGSQYRYDFGNSVDFTDHSIALQSCNVWFSFPNITQSANNNKFSIIHPTSTGTTTLALTLPDGGYNVSDINDYLRWYLISNGYYIQNNSTGEQTVYCKLIVNPSTYQVQFISYPLPTALPSGYTAGSAITFPATSKGPQLVVPANNFGAVIGFVANATYPAVQPTAITTIGSTLTPVVNEISNVVVGVDSVSNKFNMSNINVIHSFSIAGYKYASLMSSEPRQLSFVKMASGFRSNFTITLYDQFMRPLKLLDSDSTIILQLRKDT
jgi:hypothetical protein